MTRSPLGLAGHAVHTWYQRVYTLWRVRREAGGFRGSLSFAERLFYLEFRPALLGQDLVVYDVGAAGGVVSSCLAKLPNVRAVHAFEPLPDAFAELTQRTRRYRHVTCHNVALGDSSGAVTMRVVEGCRDSSSLLKMQTLHKSERPGVSYQEHMQGVMVVRLDDYREEKELAAPDVVKIDVQGYEDRVLRGGQETVRHAEFCIAEMSLVSLYEGAPLFDAVYLQMRGLGFRLAGIGGLLYGQSGRQLQIDGIFQNEHKV